MKLLFAVCFPMLFITPSKQKVPEGSHLHIQCPFQERVLGTYSVLGFFFFGDNWVSDSHVEKQNSFSSAQSRGKFPSLLLVSQFSSAGPFSFASVSTAVS